MSSIINQTFLYWDAGRYERYYNIYIIKENQTKFSVKAEYGKKGTVLKEHYKIKNCDYLSALKTYKKILNKRVKDGYHIVLDNDFSTSLCIPKLSKEMEKLVEEGYRVIKL